MFKVGQKIEILNPEEIGLEDVYKENSIFTVSEVDEDGDAVDEEGLRVTRGWVEKGYARILQKENKLTPRDLACFDEVARVIGEDKAEQELAVVIDGGFYEDTNAYDLRKSPLFGSFNWYQSPQGGDFWNKIDDGINPYKESRIDVIGQNGNDGEHYDEVEKENKEDLDAISKRCREYLASGDIEFVDMDGKPIDGKKTMLQDKEFLENYDKHQAAVKAMDELHTSDNFNQSETPQKTPAYAFLEAGVKHMKDRASERDTGEERSMKSCVNAFNAMYADIVKANKGNLTEELGWMFMVFLKASRAKGGDYRQDDYEDGAAYFALAGESSSIERKKLFSALDNKDKKEYVEKCLEIHASTK